MRNNFVLGGIDAFNDLHLLVNEIHRPVAPSNQIVSQDIPAMVGSIPRSNNMTTRTITLDVTILADRDEDRNTYTHIIADALYTPSDGDSELTFDDEPGVTYYGRFSGDAPITRLDANGQATLTFIMSDPYAYLEQEEASLTSAVTDLDVQGTQPTEPIFNAVVNKDISYLSVMTADKYIYLGQNVDETSGEVAQDLEPAILADNMDDLSNWTALTEATKTFVTYAGVSAGAFATNLATYVGDYGVGDQFHGPLAERMLSQALTDWRVKMRVNFAASASAQKGKLTLYLLGENKQKIGMIELKDSDQYNDVRVHTDIGTDSSSHLLYDGSGATTNTYSHRVANYRKVAHTTKVKKTRVVRKKVRGKWQSVKETYYTTSTYYTTDVYYTTVYNNSSTGGNLVSSYSEFNNFWGYLELEKKGNVFTAYVIRLDGNFNEIHRDTYTWIDSANQYTGNKLAGIAIWAAAWGTNDPINYLCFTNLQVQALNDVDGSAPPIIAHAGDEIMIDCESEVIYKNGERFMQYLSVGSQWLKLQGGDTEAIGVAPIDSAGFSVTYRAKQL